MRIFEVLEKTDECYGNIKECVEITSNEFEEFLGNDECGRGDSLYNIFNDNNAQLYSTHKEKFQIEIKLNERVRTDGYWIETRHNTKGCIWTFPNNFSLEGSNDNNTYHTLDSHEGNELNKRGELIYFPTTSSIKYYKYFRFNFEGVDEEGKWVGISRIEINGTFYIKQDKTCDQSKSFIHINSLFIFISFLK